MHIAQHKWTALKEIPRVEALIFGAWNSLPECYSEVKKLTYGVLTIFGSTYSCEQAFSSEAARGPGKPGNCPWRQIPGGAKAGT
ncbi:hypothetical protein AVEN_17313-1 [Araneus ventricosus]|uniref:HAT C-terminal dimerisation domain-containing protein n=1 Tax=Araneus ventricosus TaxID=182803 RepID=A0A4Y2WAH6_ARAVE|nr:hypothetical protein AVEN_17313-1 [Araneus ventricosus]